jgi:hypothetical protein
MQKITQQEYDSFKLRVIKQVTDNVIKYGKKEPEYVEQPTLYMKAFNRNHKIAPLPHQLFQTEQTKDLAVELIREMIKLSESPIMCFVTEGYQAKVPLGTDINNLPRPSQLPEDQRDDVIFLAFETYNLEGYTISFLKKYINDNWKLTPYPMPNDTKVDIHNTKQTGRFSNFYNKV